MRAGVSEARMKSSGPEIDVSEGSPNQCLRIKPPPGAQLTPDGSCQALAASTRNFLLPLSKESTVRRLENHPVPSA